MKYRLFFLILFLILCGGFTNTAFAQAFGVKGRVVDSLQIGISGASVVLYMNKDTLRTRTDRQGYFGFNNIRNRNFSLKIAHLGYTDHSVSLHYTGDDLLYKLPTIILYPEAVQLDEVVVNAPPAMRTMRDTVEYRASAYKIRERDKLDDLLRQLPGISIDANGKVTAMGQSMTKLRVNGKDFFTNNLEDFLRQLPADIIEKLQVIDDYGDQANFTGVKIGKPQKMLNLVIKEGKSHGVFGSIGGNVSTRKMYGGSAEANLWREVHQIGSQLGHTDTPTDEGRQRNSYANLNYRWQQSNAWNVFGNYNYGRQGRVGSTESYVESINPQGTLYTELQNDQHTIQQQHRVQLSLQYRSKRNFLDVQLGGQTADGENMTRTQSKQRGISMQEQDNQVEGNSTDRNGNMSFSWSRNMQKQGRNLRAQLSFNGQQGRDESKIRDLLRYFDQETGLPRKDSLSRRELLRRQRQAATTFSLAYSEPLSNPEPGNHKRYLDVQYNFSWNQRRQRQDTEVEQEGGLQYIDSLSNGFVSGFDTHRLDFAYRESAARLEYSLGMSLQPSRMRGSYTDRDSSISYRMTNVLPIASIRYIPSSKDNLTLTYSGQASAPAMEQLMPIRDVRNLQQVLIGNPDLKPSVRHGVNLDVNRIQPTKGNTYHLSLYGSTVRNQVVSDVRLITDTLQGLRQETYYRNVNGSYSLGAGYDMTLPFAKYYQFRFGSSGNWSRNPSYAGGVEGTNRSLSLNASSGLSIYTQKLTFTAALNYGWATTAYQLDSTLRTDIQTWDMSGDARYRCFSWLTLGSSIGYRINKGYRVPIVNPVLLNGYAELLLSAKKEISIQVQGYDLLDQQQAVYQTATANSISQRVMNRIGRYVQLRVKANLARFGGG